MEHRSIKRKRRETLNSIGLAILLCANPLSWLYPTDNIIIGFSLLSLLIVVLNNPINIFVNKNIFLLVGIILLFIFSYIFASIDYTRFSLYFFSFFAFGFTGILYSSTDLNYRVLYKAIFVISILSLPGIYRISNTDYRGLGDVSGFWMGVSQGALRLLLGVILVIPFLKNKLLKTTSILVIIVYLSFYFNYGTRSAILGLGLFLFFYYLIRKKILTIKMFALISIFGLVSSFFIIDITLVIQSFLEQIGVSIKAIDKIVAFSSRDQELSNGRIYLWSEALKEISISPFFGNGISAFEKKHGTYPHNFLIQTFHEGGFLYLIFILTVFFKFFKLLLSENQSTNTKLFLIYLLFGGIIELIFSNVYWRNVYFWFFISYVINLSIKSVPLLSNKKSMLMYKSNSK